MVCGGSPCSPPSPCGISWVSPSSSSHRYVDGSSVETPDEWEDPISVLHPQKSSQHGVPGDQIVRPDPVDGHSGRIPVQICESPQDVSNALTPCFRGQRLCFVRLASKPVWLLFLPQAAGQCRPRRSPSRLHLDSAKPWFFPTGCHR